MSNLVIIVQLTALPAWLALTRTQRHEVIEREITPALASQPKVTVRWVDAEGLTATCSDVLLAETRDLRSWNHLWERVRDSSLFAVPYFRLDAIIPGIEDAYLDFEATHPDMSEHARA